MTNCEYNIAGICCLLTERGNEIECGYLFKERCPAYTIHQEALRVRQNEVEKRLLEDCAGEGLGGLRFLR